MRKLSLIILFFILCFAPIASFSTVSYSLISAPSLLQSYNKFEIRFNLTGIPTSINPYNPDDIDVTVSFRKPGSSYWSTNRFTKAFWYRNFVRNSGTVDPTTYSSASTRGCGSKNGCYIGQNSSLFCANDPAYLTPTDFFWVGRFTPVELGLWHYTVHVNIAGIVYDFPEGSFVVKPSSNPGFVKTKNRNFIFSKDESIFFPIGTSGVWNAGNPTCIYNRAQYLYCIDAIDQTARDGGNYLRLFLDQEKFGIEWESLGEYSNRQNRAFDLDAIIEHAKEKGVYLQLCIDEAGAFGYVNNWTTYSNPYSSITGAQPEGFFTNNSAKKNYKNKLRYIVSRWGYSTNVFCFELFNEIDHYGMYGGTSPVNFNWWGGISGDCSGTSPGTVCASTVKNWSNEMIAYCKTLDKNHMYTNSFATPNMSDAQGDESSMGNSAIDFYTDHHYSHSFNVDHIINYFSNSARVHKPNKPYFLGEFGTNNYGACRPFLTTPSYLPFFTYQAFHNSLWSSVMSGSSGTAMYWGNELFDLCWGQQTNYFLPLKKFLQNEDLDLSHSFSVVNNCEGDGYTTSATDENCVSTDIATVPDDSVHKYISIKDLSTGALNNKNIEAFALIQPSKVLGWVHNKQNYWYNLPHTYEGSPTDCSSLETISYNRVPSYTRQQMIIEGVQCDGEYKIEFYSTYPQYPLAVDGPLQNGGKITFPSTAAITTTATVTCGKMLVNLPTLSAFDGTNKPYAPDYAFKASLIKARWGHDLIGQWNNWIQPFGIDGNGRQIAYRGPDGRLRCYYRLPGSLSWMNTPLTINNPALYVKLDGAITRGRFSSNIPYRGQDNKLQMVYWNTLFWDHIWLTDWTSSSQDVDGQITSNAGGDRIFYRGADGKLHLYYYSGGWHHRILYYTDFDLVAKDGSISVSDDGGLVTYKATDGKLHMFYYVTSAGAWYHDYSPTDYIGGMIRSSADGSRHIYVGTDNHLYMYYWNVTHWTGVPITLDGGVPITVNGPFDINYDGTQIFFRGWTDQINAVFLSGGFWIQDYLMCYSKISTTGSCNYNGSIHYANGVLAYQGDYHTSYFQAYYFNECANNWPKGIKVKAKLDSSKDNEQMLNPLEYENGCCANENTVVTNVVDMYISAGNSYNPIKELATLSSYTLMPNPSNGEITIRKNNFEDEVINLQIMNIEGQTIFNAPIQINNGSGFLNMQNEKTGTYIVEITNAKAEHHVSKIIIAR